MFFQKRKLIIELTDSEIRIFNGLSDDKSCALKVLHISLDKGVISRGQLQDEDKLAELLKKWRTEYFRKGIPEAILLLPAGDCILRDFILPWINTKDRESGIIYQAAREMPVSLEELAYNYDIENPEDKQSLLVYLRAIKKTLMQKYENCLSAAGIKVIAAELAVTARGGALCKQFPERYILDLEKSDGAFWHLVLYRNGRPCLAKYAAGKNIEMIKRYLHHQLKGDDLSGLRMITDGSPEAEQFGQELFDGREIPLTAMGKSDFSLFSIRGALESSPAQMSGLHRQKEKNRRLSYASGLLIVILAFFSTSMYGLAKQQELKGLEKEIGELRQTAEDKNENDAFAAGSDPADLTKEEIVLLGKTVGIEAEGIQIQRLNLKNRTLLIWGKSASDVDLITLNHTLNEKGWGRPTLVQYQYEQGKGIAFCLSVQEAGDSRDDENRQT